MGSSHFTDITWDGVGSKCRTYFDFDSVASGASMFHKHMSSFKNISPLLQEQNRSCLGNQNLANS